MDISDSGRENDCGISDEEYQLPSGQENYCGSDDEYLLPSAKKYRKSSEKKFSCRQCDWKFKTSYDLKRHELSHTSHKPFRCTICDKTFARMDSLKAHNKSILCLKKEEPPDFDRDDLVIGQTDDKKMTQRQGMTSDEKENRIECKKEASFVQNKGEQGNEEHPMNSTKTRKELDVDRPYSCPQCEWKFKTVRDIRRHELTHTNYKPFTCTICNMKFRRDDSLKAHNKRCHPNVGSPHLDYDELEVAKNIEIKQETSEYINKWEEQRNVEHPLNSKKKHMEMAVERPYSCPQCDWKFKTLRDVRRHELTHSNDKPFICTICDMKFRRNDSLQAHYKRCHKNVESTHCDELEAGKNIAIKQETSEFMREFMKFAGNDGVNDSSRNEDSPSDQKEVPHKPIPDQGSSAEDDKLDTLLKVKKSSAETKVSSAGQGTNKSDVKGDNKKLDDEKYYSCTQCDRKFIKKYDLKRHEFTRHSNDRPFSCKMCYYRCSRKDSLKAHILRCHKNVNLRASTLEIESDETSLSYPHGDDNSIQGDGLKIHKRTQLMVQNIDKHDTSKELFSCSECKRSFTSQDEYKGHECNPKKINCCSSAPEGTCSKCNFKSFQLLMMCMPNTILEKKERGQVDFK